MPFNFNYMKYNLLHIQVPIAIGGPGLSSRASLRTDLPNAGLSNVTATFINLLGYEAPPDYEPTLIKID